MIELNKIKLRYENFEFYIDLNIPKNSFTIIMGISGSGKSTLLNIIAGFIKPLSGKLVINNNDMTSIPPSKRDISMLFQKDNLFTHMTVFENIAIGINTNLKLNQEQNKRLNEIMHSLEIESLKTKSPSQISGGEEQRVGIARCLLQNKSILLLDEPFANLDPIIRYKLYKIIYNKSKEYKKTTLVISHFPYEIKNYAEDVIFLNKGKVMFYGKGNNFYNSSNKNILEIYEDI